MHSKMVVIISFWHDIDMIPEEGTDYSFPEKTPIHIATHISQMNYELKYQEYFGGAVLLVKNKLKKPMDIQMIIGIGVWKMMICFGDVI